MVQETVQTAIELLKTLAQIPAPSGQEQARAAFCHDWLITQGAAQTYIDQANNVICPIGVTEDDPVIVFCAHSDVVFSDTDPLPLYEENGRLYCPGIGDDTANVVALMMTVKYCVEQALLPRDCGLLFVIDAGEEGLGNLKGTKQVMADFGHRVKEFLSFDCHADEVIADAVGSRRFLIEVDTVGGHSYFDFGNDNAIARLSSMVAELYSMTVPAVGTTFNVGRIEGGTSVNTIAQHAQMLFELRSNNREHLETMQTQTNAILAKYDGVSVTLLGERPCAGEVDAVRQQVLVDRAVQGIQRRFGLTPTIKDGSTDCNVPLSMGIPSVCFGCVRGAGMHTREEYIELDSLAHGLQLAQDTVKFYCE